MLTNDHIAQMLDMMEHPAFSVRDGIVTNVNAAAKERMIPVGEPVLPLIRSGRQEYSLMESGSMALTLELFGISIDATVTCVGEHRIFRLSVPEESALLRVLALAAQELRCPLHDAMALTRAIQEDALPCAQEDLTARLSRELHRILRIVGNMSFQAVPRPEMHDVAALLDEIFDSAAAYCEAAGVKLSYTSLPTAVYSMADGDLLGRAVHNLLSNAIRGAGAGGTITARLTRRSNALYLTVEDSGGSERPATGNIFHAYRREPGIAADQGLGLGMTIVEAAAKAHGGVVILEQVAGSGLRVSLSLPIRQSGCNLCSPRVRIDYAGEQSRELIEFSDVLPPEFYKN